MMTFAALHRHLEALVGPDSVWVDEAQRAAHTVAGCRPRLVVQPETVAQAAEIVALAGRERFAVVPWGQGTQMHLGQTPARYDLALSLTRLTRVIEYDSANLVLIAEAGLGLRQVYQLTAPQRQFLPLGCASTAASLGGLLVTNTSGVKRLRYGGVRDLLLGVRVALPDGAVAHFGGRVVKNVAGYDMNKLFIGSLGAFGVVLATTYRLAALPEEDSVLAVVFPSLTRALAAVAALRATPLLPAALLLLHADVARAWAPTLGLPVASSQVVLLLNYDGIRAAVTRQLRDSRTLCQTHGSLTDVTLTGAPLNTLWELYEHWCHAPAPTAQPSLTVRFGTLPGALETTLAHLAGSPAFSQPDIAWLADAAHGHVWARLALRPAVAPDPGRAVSAWLHAMRVELQARHGYVVLASAPEALLQQCDVWGKTASAPLLSLYKQYFDPHAVLNPGRYVTGL